jgi:hypothetical protein
MYQTLCGFLVYECSVSEGVLIGFDGKCKDKPELVDVKVNDWQVLMLPLW